VIAALDAVLAIVALGAIGIILVMLAIVYTPPRNVRTGDAEAPAPARAEPSLLTRRRPRRVSGLRRIGSQTWGALVEAIVNRLQPWARRIWAEDHGEIPAFGLIAACSVVIGYVIVHM